MFVLIFCDYQKYELFKSEQTPIYNSLCVLISPLNYQCVFESLLLHYKGVCLGMQVAAIEFARNVLDLKG